jgi:ribosomal protein L37AE/L43A
MVVCKPLATMRVWSCRRCGSRMMNTVFKPDRQGGEHQIAVFVVADDAD